jgi:alpha-beta hydrolase superfamily lysophospholipase
MTPITAETVEIHDGLLIPYVEQGDPDGVPLVLLHGITDSHRSYEPVLAALPDSIRGVAITARGHGDAGKPETGYDADQMAADVIAVMDALGIERAIVAGHSMGSWTARRVAVLYPERCSASYWPAPSRASTTSRRWTGCWRSSTRSPIRSTRPTPARGRTARWAARSPRPSWR